MQHLQIRLFIMIHNHIRTAVADGMFVYLFCIFHNMMYQPQRKIS